MPQYDSRPRTQEKALATGIGSCFNRALFIAGILPESMLMFEFRKYYLDNYNPEIKHVAAAMPATSLFHGSLLRIYHCGIEPGIVSSRRETVKFKDPIDPGGVYTLLTEESGLGIAEPGTADIDKPEATRLLIPSAAILHIVGDSRLPTTVEQVINQIRV
jgi:hypothetical protein